MEKSGCPACGSNQINKSVYKEYISEKLGDRLSIEKVRYQCSDCGTEGDFFDENEPLINKALLELKNKLVVSILDGFLEKKISLSSIERALELPQRTLTKWKNGISSPSSAGVALLKFIKLFPWLLEVAENQFDYDISQKIFMMNACLKMINKMKFYELEFKESYVTTTPNSHILHFYKEIKGDITPEYYMNMQEIGYITGNSSILKVLQ